MSKEHVLLLKKRGAFRKLVIIYGSLFLGLMLFVCAVAFYPPLKAKLLPLKEEVA